MSKLFLLLARVFFFCGLITIARADSIPHQWFWNQANSPGKLMTSYNTKFWQLPLQGRLTKTPWSGDYWGTYLGGITYRWFPLTKNTKDVSRYGYKLYDMNNMKGVDLRTLSPAEKYDLYVGDKNWSITKWERNRTGIMKIVPGSPQYVSSHKIPKWFGLCHNWAPATVLYDNPGPIKAIGKTGVEIPFGASDIKALLDLHMEFAKSPTKFLGSRCNLSLKTIYKKYTSGEISQAEYLKAFNDDACSDTNAGSFHVTIANTIGTAGMSFILDVTRGDEVWNQAAYGYQSVIKGRRAHNNYIQGFYISEIITIETVLTYIGEVPKTWEKEINPKSFKPKKYNYELFIDYNGNIVGGNWLTYERPDFLWTRQMPRFDHGMKALEGLYNDSVSDKKPTVSKRSGKELLKLFKKTVKKMMLAQKFIKSSKELVAERKEMRRKQIEADKKALKERLEREERERLKRLEEERRKKKKFNCQYSMYDPKGNFIENFGGQAVTMELACQVARRDCNLLTRGTQNFCAQGKRGKIYPLCEVSLFHRRQNALKGTYRSQAENAKMACSMARSQCQDVIKRRIRRARNKKQMKRRMKNLYCKKGVVKVGNKVIPNRNPPRPNPPGYGPGRPPISTRPGMNPPPASVPYPTGTIAPPRKPFTVNAGPIWNQKDAQKKCPKICKSKNAKWGGGWWTTVPGKMSVCSCK